VGGIVATFSRSGFLGLAAMIGFGLFKWLPRRPGTTVVAAVTLAGLLAIAAPGGYGDRLGSIVDHGADKTGSATERIELLKRAVAVASRHLVIGVGIGNYHIYSIREMRAHNAYVEIAAELGLAGLLAYLVLIFWPLYHLRRVEREARGGESDEARETAVLALALQAAFLGYIVCSFFASIQYLWYLYYLVAYAIALRRVHDAATSPHAVRKVDERPRGVLWPARAQAAARGVAR
jgi:O-antigen ligase